MGLRFAGLVGTRVGPTCAPWARSTFQWAESCTLGSKPTFWWWWWRVCVCGGGVRWSHWCGLRGEELFVLRRPAPVAVQLLPGRQGSGHCVAMGWGEHSDRNCPDFHVRSSCQPVVLTAENQKRFNLAKSAERTAHGRSTAHVSMKGARPVGASDRAVETLTYTDLMRITCNARHQLVAGKSEKEERTSEVLTHGWVITISADAQLNMIAQGKCH